MFSLMEVSFHSFVWIGSVFYSLYALSKYNSYFDNVQDSYGDFSKGWLILNRRRKDSADIEWQSFLVRSNDTYPWIIFSLIVTEYLRKKSYAQALDVWHILLSISFILYKIGTVCLTVLLVQPILFEIVSLARSKVALWSLNALCLLIVNIILKSPPPILGVFDVDELDHYLLIIASAWINLRCLSFHVDNVDQTATKKNFSYYAGMLSYILYLPTLFLGPFLFYCDFEKRKDFKNMPSIFKRLRKLICRLFRFGFWLIFTEFFLHLFYVNVYGYEIQLLNKFSTWALYGYGYSMGQYFHLKYVVMYGLTTTIAQFEGIAIPDTPKCIGRIHLYSDMWKYFDRNIHRFLLRYIYIPTLTKKSIQCKIFSSMLSFAFVFAWHGTEYFIFVWTFLNFIGITMELIFKHLLTRHLVNTKIYADLSERCRTRIACALSSPLLVLSAVSNFYFFAGDAAGYVFVQRFLNGNHNNNNNNRHFYERLFNVNRFVDSWKTNLFVLFILYCCCVVSTENLTKLFKNAKGKN